MHVLFAIDEKYADVVPVAAGSIRRNLPGADTELTFHVIDSGLEPGSRTRMEREVGRFGNLHVHSEARANRLTIAPVIDRRHWSDTILSYLHLGDLLPDDVHRVIYLDADVLVLSDLTELWNYDLGDTGLAAVVSALAPTRLLRLTPQGLFRSETGGIHFNSGVMVIDVDHWRAGNVTARAIQLHREYGESMPSIDQDVLNLIYADGWTVLPETWNKLIEHAQLGPFGRGRMDFLLEPEGILHYVGAVKPWMPAFPDGPLLRLWQDYAGQGLIPRR